MNDFKLFSGLAGAVLISLIPCPASANNARDAAQIKQFRVDAAPFEAGIVYFEPWLGRPDVTPKVTDRAAFVSAAAQLKGLHALCQSKYKDFTPPTRRYSRGTYGTADVGPGFGCRLVDPANGVVGRWEKALAVNEMDANFAKDSAPFKSGIDFFAPALAKPEVTVLVTEPEKFVAAAEQLKGLHAICKSKYKDVPAPTASSPYGGPAQACRLADPASGIVKRAAQGYAAWYVGRIARSIDENRVALSKTEGMVNLVGLALECTWRLPACRTKVAAQVTPVLQAAGEADTTPPLASVDTAVTAYWAEINRLAPTYKAPTGLIADGAFAARVKARLSEWEGNPVEIVTWGFTSKEYEISRTVLGLLEYRGRGGEILYKVPVEKTWCLFRKFSYLETWDGTKWQKSDKIDFGSLRYQACK